MSETLQKLHIKSFTCLGSLPNGECFERQEHTAEDGEGKTFFISTGLKDRNGEEIYIDDELVDDEFDDVFVKIYLDHWCVMVEKFAIDEDGYKDVYHVRPLYEEADYVQSCIRIQNNLDERWENEIR